jgi:hypothetical protein
VGTAFYNKIPKTKLTNEEGLSRVQVKNATRLPVNTSSGVSSPNTFPGVKFNNRILLSISLL